MYNIKYHDEDTAIVYIMELICKRKAKKDGVLLEKYFWRDPLWQSFYSEQMMFGKRLLNLYDEKTVVKTIEEKHFWSLRPKFVSEEIMKRAALINKKQKQEEKAYGRQEEVITENTTTESRKVWRK